jgi:DNA ligase (NAD+)
MLHIPNIQQFIKENPVDKLTLDQAKQIYDKVVEDLNTHNYLYYVKSQPIVSDYEYDLLFHYLEDLEKKFPSLIKPYSPTQRLTNQVQEELKKASHKHPLLSLENTYNSEEVIDKLNKIEEEIKNKLSPKSPSNSQISFYVEPKYD